MTFELALAAVFSLGWIPLWILRTESFSKALPLYRGSERMWVKLAPALVALHVSIACITVSITPLIPRWRVVASIILFVSGIVFWLWARWLISPPRTRRLPDQPPLALRRDGPFGLVRNPLYLGVLVISLAPTVAAARWFLVPTYVLCVIALAIRAEQDEQRLHQLLGRDYAEYCQEVKRLIPFVW